MKFAKDKNHRGNKEDKACHKCSSCTNHLVEVIKTRPNKKRQQQQRQGTFRNYVPHDHLEELCPNCLVGHNIPIFRNTLNEWGMGIVKDYDDFGWKYFVQYPDQSNEWTNISRRPMSSYLSYWKSKYKDNTKNKPTQLNSKQNVDSSRIRSRHKRQFSPDIGNGNYERQEEFQYVCSPSDFSSDIELCNTDGSDKSSTLICIDDIELGKRVCEKSDNPSLKEKSRLVSPAIANKSDNRRMKRHTKQTWVKENGK